MPSLPSDLRNKLERAIIEARDVAEAGAEAALKALAVNHHEPFPHQSPEERRLRNHLRAHARQLGDNQDASGRLYVAPGGSWGTDAPVLRYDSWGAAAPGLTYAALPNQSRPQSLAVDASDRVYAVVAYMDAAIYRFGTDGALDATFGAGGAVDLSAPVMGAPVCYAGAVAVNTHHIYVADTCNLRILRFTLAGVADGAFAMPDNGYPVPMGLFADGDGVWMLRSHQIVRIADAANAPMTVGQVIPLDPTLNGPKGLTRGADGVFWTGDGVAGIQAVGTDGARVAGWWGGGTYDLLGAFELPQDVVTLPNGDVAVLGADGPRLVRFDGTIAAP